MNAVETAERIKNEELRMITAVAPLKNDCNQVVKALKTLEDKTQISSLNEPSKKAVGSLVQRRSKKIRKRGVDEEHKDKDGVDKKHNENEILQELSSSSWRKFLYVFI